ncbi:MAG: glycine cleavage system protein H [Verrucomicrobia bacterium A1]|nr:MAG: glycine cleavage system protein H [Verrucomicrobia bacterium A1]
MNIPRDLRYTKSHEWVRLAGGLAVVGITDYAQHQLSDLTYIELPSVGDDVEAESEVAVVESVKAASDVYAPIAGTIMEVNDKLLEQPETINSDPYGAGWMFKIKPAEPDDISLLLDAESYEETLGDSEE